MSTDDCLGGAKSLLEMVTLLKNHGIDITVVNPFNNKLNLELKKRGIENYSAGYQLNICRRDCSGVKWLLKFNVKKIRYLICQRMAIRKIKRNLDVRGFDVIHSNNSVEDIGAYFASKYKIPHIWHIREFGKEDFDFEYFKKEMGKYISDNSTRVIAISEAIRNCWKRKGLDDKKTVTIVHGVDPSGIRRAGYNNDKIKMIFAGAVLPQKGQFDFIKILASLPSDMLEQINLDIYGTCDASYEKEILDYINAKGLSDTVKMKGYSAQIKELLQEYDVGIVNSRCEGMGRVTIEYMFAGLCVLASDRGANRELLNDGNCGFLYEYENLSDIQEKIITIIQNKDLIVEYGKRAYRRATDKYSIINNVEKYIELYKEILDESL